MGLSVRRSFHPDTVCKLASSVSQDDFEKPFKKLCPEFIFKPCKDYQYFFLRLVFQKEDEYEMGPAESKCQEDFMSLRIAFNAVHLHDARIRVLFDPFLKVFVVMADTVMADTVSAVLCTGPGSLLALFILNFPPQVDISDIEYAGINVSISRSF